MPGQKGNKGGGRKSAYTEEARAEMLANAWFDEGVDLEFLKNVLAKKEEGKGKIKLYDIFLAKALSSERILAEQAKKLFPDLKQGTMDVNMNMTFADWAKKAQPKKKRKKK